MAAIPVGEIKRAPPSVLAGVELGGTKCVCILATGPDDIIAVEQIPTGEPAQTLEEIASLLCRWQGQHKIVALGITSFGPLNVDDNSPGYGSITTTPKEGWSGVDLTQLAGCLPYAIDTDVNGAAMAEGLWGAATGLRTWSYITLGTGLGVASIVEGQSVTGLGHSEAGHMRVPTYEIDFAGTCPFHGDCAEGLISGPALSAWAGKSAAAISDDDAMWDQVARILAYICHNLTFTTLPQRILIGGGIAQKRPFLLDRARAHFVNSLGGYAHAQTLENDRSGFLMPPGLGEMAGPLGAIALAKRCTANSG